MPFIIGYYRGKEIKILIDTGATNCYCKPNFARVRNRLIIMKRVNSYSIITHSTELRILGKKQRFYELENLGCDLLLGINFIKSNGIKLDFVSNKLELEGTTYDIKYINEMENKIGLPENKVKANIQNKITSEQKDSETPARKNTAQINKCKNVEHKSSTMPATIDTANNDNIILRQSLEMPAERDTSHKNYENLRKIITKEIESLHKGVDMNLLFRTDVRAETRTCAME